jgi:hypothetical protein
MASIVIPYTRFLETRQRRQHVAAELTPPAIALPDGNSWPVQPPPADDGVGGDETRAARAAVRHVGTGATPDRGRR